MEGVEGVEGTEGGMERAWRWRGWGVERAWRGRGGRGEGVEG